MGALSDFGLHVGLAFQAVDDVLDATGDAAALGKSPGKDAKHGRQTLVAQLGPEEAKAMARQLSGQAIEALASLPASAAPLRELAHLLLERSY